MIETPWVRSWFGPHLNKLMPVLYWFAWIGQHGRPVLPPGTVGVAAHTTHPYNLVMTDAETQGSKEEKKREKRQGWLKKERKENRLIYHLGFGEKSAAVDGGGGVEDIEL